MKKYLFLFLIFVSSLASAQTNIAKWWKATPQPDSSIPTLTNGMWYYSSDSGHYTFYENGKYKHLGSGGTGALATNHIFVGNGSNVATDVAMSGDGSIVASGALTITGIRGSSVPSLTAGFLKYTGSAWTFDNSTYLTGNQTITLSGDISGSGTTAITTSIGAGKVTNTMLVNNSTTLNAGTNFGITAPGAMTLGSTYTLGSTSDNLRFNGLGLGVASPSSGGQISTILGANNVTAIQVKRNTDTSPTGNFIDFQNAASSSLFKVDITGSITTGSYTATKINLAYGGTNSDLSATGGASQVLKQTSVGGNITVGQLAFTDISGTASDGQLTTSYLKADGSRALTADWGAGTFSITGIKSYAISGTAGNGYGEFIAQSSNASAPSSSGFRLFAGSSGSFNWARKNGSDTFVRTFDATLTADRTYTLQDASSTLAMYSNNLSVFASTTSSQLAGVISDETGTNKLVYSDNATLVAPALGTPASGVATNITGLPLTTGVTGILPIANGGSNKSSFTSGSVIYYDGTRFQEDNSNLFYDGSNHRLAIGNTVPVSTLHTSTTSTSTIRGVIFEQNNSGTNSSKFYLRKSRNTFASPSVITTGDALGNITFSGYDGTNFTDAADFFVTSTGTISTGIVQGTVTLRTANSSGTLTAGILMDQNQVLTLTSAASNNSITGTWTASANNQNHLSVTPSITSRSTSSDNVNGLNLSPSFTANAASIVTQAQIINNATSTPTSGISTVAQFATSAAPYNTLAGMTVTTFTSVAPASTSGSGTGALFTIVVATATTLTSITQTTAGSGYKLYETVTFNGSSLGGSGSATFVITALTSGNTYTAVPLILESSQPLLRGVPNTKWISFLDQTGSEVAQIGHTVSNSVTASPNGGMYFSDENGVWFQSNPSSGQATLSRGLSVGGNFTIQSGSTFNTGSGAVNFNGTATFTKPNNLISATLTQTQTSYGFQANDVVGGLYANTYVHSGFQSNHSSVQVGVIATLSVNTAGSGYSAGSKALTVSTGSGTGSVNATITVSGGAITGATISVNAKGLNFAVGDLLTVAGGTGGVLAVASIDYAGVVSGFSDISSVTDAKSNYNYASFHAAPTYNITSTQVGNIYGLYYNPTLTATGSFGNYGIVVSTNTPKNGIGSSTPDATWYIKGNGSIPTLKTIGAGTSTNYSIRSYQSDGTTQIFGLQDNGNATFNNGNLTLGTAGNKLFITEGSNGSVGQVALVSGTKAVTITGTTTSSRCFVTLVSQGGTVTTTVDYSCACTSNTVTLTALTTAGATNTSDTSTLNYWIVN